MHDVTDLRHVFVCLMLLTYVCDCLHDVTGRRHVIGCMMLRS